MNHMEMCIHEKVMNEKAQSIAHNAEISHLLCSAVQNRLILKENTLFEAIKAKNCILMCLRKRTKDVAISIDLLKRAKF